MSSQTFVASLLLSLRSQRALKKTTIVPLSSLRHHQEVLWAISQNAYHLLLSRLTTSPLNLHTNKTGPQMLPLRSDLTPPSSTWRSRTHTWECCFWTTAQHLKPCCIPSQLVTTFRDLGLSSALCSRILNFLTKRPQEVRSGDITSSTVISSSRIPRGCVPSQILCALFTNDCVATLSSNHRHLNHQPDYWEQWGGLPRGAKSPDIMVYGHQSSSQCLQDEGDGVGL